MNPKLKDAVAIYEKYGWKHVTAENVLTLSVGTAEEKKLALEGLKSGALGAMTTDGTYKWKDYFKLSQEKLALFAIRVGVTPARANTLLPWHHLKLKKALVPVISERGAKFAASLIQSAYKTWPMHDDTAILLVDVLNLDIPQNANYIHDWMLCVRIATGLDSHHWKEFADNIKEVALKRFDEHIHTGFEVNVHSGELRQITVLGVQHGLLERTETLPLIYTALDAAVSPSDRKNFLQLLDDLNITDQELSARTQAFIPLLATGDNVIVNRLAPTLIAHASEDILAEVILSSLSAPTKKARLLVLKAAQKRQCPPDAEELASWLTLFAADKDKSIAAAAAKLIATWGIVVEKISEEEAEIQGLWQDTPPLWQVPAFETGDISQTALTDLVAELFTRPEGSIHDITVERMMAVVTSLAYTNIEDVRIGLSGLREDQLWSIPTLFFLAQWNEDDLDGAKISGRYLKLPILCRNLQLIANLGKVPSMLSTPSKEDLSVTVPDLAARLTEYGRLGISALKQDLFVALCRLDVATQTAESVKMLEAAKVQIIRHDGKVERTLLKVANAAQIVLDYLSDPFTEKHLSMPKNRYSEDALKMPKSLTLFHTTAKHVCAEELFSLFPHFGDIALRSVGWNQGYTTHDTGLILRQVARRKEPLPTGGAINFLSAQRSLSPREQDDATLAVTEAWERGLLRPGVADIKLLDWNDEPPSNLALFATALESIARDGMLSVVWPIMDGLVETSLEATRMLAGTAELAEVMAELLPEVLFAVQNGKTDKTALNLPGVRVLAARGGSSKAVEAARKIAALLPKLDVPDVPAKKPAATMEIPFDKLWPKCTAPNTIIEDGVTMQITLPDKAKQFLFSLTLPDVADSVFLVSKGWTYDLEAEGQCQAQAATPGTTALAYNFAYDADNVYLQWCEDSGAMMVNDSRDREGYRGKKRNQIPKLSQSLLTLAIALLAQDGDTIYYSKDLVKKFIAKDQINQYVMYYAVQTILQNPDVSPAKLARLLEKDVTFLPVMWPILTESIKFAGQKVAAGEKLLQWTNRILDIALRYAPYLKEAAARGFMLDTQWEGLESIANAKMSSTAVAKAKELLILQT